MSTSRRILVVVTCAAVALGLMSGTAIAKTKDGCKALTTADVNAALSGVVGDQAGEGVPNPFEGYVSCTWRFPTSGFTVFLGVDKVSKAAKDDFKARSKEPGVEKVPGLKKSFLSDAAEIGSAVTITFIDGTTFVNLQVFSSSTSTDTEPMKQPLTTLAKKAAKKL